MSSFLRNSPVLQIDPDSLSPLKRRGIKGLQFVLTVAASFDEDACAIRASGLAFATLLAIVPLSALLLSLLNAFGALENAVEQLQSLIVEFLIPARQDDIILYINDFVSNSNALGTFGLVLFAFSSVMLLNSIDANFNAIWGIRSSRTLLNVFSTYTSVLVFGTLLIAASFSITTEMILLISTSGWEEITLLVQLLLQYAPVLFMFIGLLLMILLIPSAYVQFSSALIGAGIGTGAWLFIRILFRGWMNTSVRNSVIYGSIAVIPIFMLWMYITWILILISLEITFVHQYFEKGGSHPVEEPTLAQSLAEGFSVFLAFAEAHYRGERPLSRNRLIKQKKISAAQVIFFTELYTQKNLLIKIGSKKDAYLPSRALSKIETKDVVEAIIGTRDVDLAFRHLSSSYAHIEEFFTAGYASLSHDSFLKILEDEEKKSLNSAE